LQSNSTIAIDRISGVKERPAAARPPSSFHQIPYLPPMKTPAQDKFDTIVKHGFHAILKPEGFKRKGNNFYRQLPDLGHIINIQKSQWGSKNDISFTINNGIFSPEYWRGQFHNQGKALTSFPTEPECPIRVRIGQLRYKKDAWYEVDEKTDLVNLIAEMRENVTQYILPWFATCTTTQDFVTLLKQGASTQYAFGKLIVFGELKMYDEAKSELERLTAAAAHNPHFQTTVIEYGRKYGLIPPSHP
jgi:hypothetical protein